MARVVNEVLALGNVDPTAESPGGSGGGGGPPPALPPGGIGEGDDVAWGWWFADVTPVLERLGDQDLDLEGLRQYARQLVEHDPDRCVPRTMGFTKRGTPLEVLVVNAVPPDAPAAVVYCLGTPRQARATGATKALLDYATSEPIMRQRTWVFVLGLDPDGVMWSEGDEPPEINFTTNSPMPEMQMLRTVRREYRPDVIYPIRTSEFDCATLTVTERIGGIVDVKSRAAAESGMTNLGDITRRFDLEHHSAGLLFAAELPQGFDVFGNQPVDSVS